VFEDALEYCHPNIGRDGEYKGEYTGIAALPSDKGTEPAAIYNMSGIRLDAPQKGINIIKMTDGSVKKAIF
jgi:hypothetical protein